MNEELFNSIMAATTPTIPDPVEDRAAAHIARRDEWHAWVDKVCDQIEPTAEGRRLRRALERSKGSASRLVRAHMAVVADTEAIRASAQAMRDGGQNG